MSKMSRRIRKTRTPSPTAGAERIEAEAAGEGVRGGRPSRGPVEGRTAVVPEFLGRKSTIDPIASRVSLPASTREALYQPALIAIGR